MAQINKFSVKAALNMSVACNWNVRPRLTLSGQLHVGRVISPDTSIIQIQSDSAFHMRFDRGTTIAAITLVGDNGSGFARYTSAAHGFSNDDVKVVCGCVDQNYNVIGIVKNKTTNTFDFETVTYTATDTGYVVDTSDTIATNDDFVYPAGEIIPFAVPWGEERKVHAQAGQAGKLGATQPYPDTPTEVLIVHFKQYLSAANSYLKFVEG